LLFSSSSRMSDVIKVFAQYHKITRSQAHFTHPSVQIVRAEHGRVPPDQVLGTGTFDLEELQQSPGWLAELNAFYEGKSFLNQHFLQE